MDLEYCCECGQPTGRAGRLDDSIYIDGPNGEIGPLCEECFSGYRVCNDCGEVIVDAKDGTYSAEDETWECSVCKPFDADGNAKQQEGT